MRISRPTPSNQLCFHQVPRTTTLLFCSDLRCFSRQAESRGDQGGRRCTFGRQRWCGLERRGSKGRYLEGDEEAKGREQAARNGKKMKCTFRSKFGNILVLLVLGESKIVVFSELSFHVLQESKLQKN